MLYNNNSTENINPLNADLLMASLKTDGTCSHH